MKVLARGGFEAGTAVGAVPPEVSVVVPCYNYGRFLPECVDSIVGQVGVTVRVLVIDDASTDGSHEVGAQLAQGLPQVEFLRHQRNRGHIATYNEGLLEWAQSPYLVLLSADDLLAPGALARSTTVLERHPSVGMVYGRTLPFTDPQRLPRGRSPRGYAVYEGGSWLAKRCREAVNVVSTPEVIVRREVQHAVGGYRPALPHAGDLDMWLRMAAISDIGYVRGVPQAYYRVHDSSMSQGVYRDPLADVRQRKAVFDGIFADHAELLERLGARPAATYRTLADEPLFAAARSHERGCASVEEDAAAVEFARSTGLTLEDIPGYRALRRRQHWGPWSHRTQAFVLSAAQRKARRSLWWWRWRTHGG